MDPRGNEAEEVRVPSNAESDTCPVPPPVHPNPTQQPKQTFEFDTPSLLHWAQLSHSSANCNLSQMDHSEESHQQQEEVIDIAYGVPQYHAGQGVATGTPVVPVSAATQAHHFLQQKQQLQQQDQLQAFWVNQMHEIEQTTDFKNHNLPLARIKKVMKADEDVRMISSEAPVLFAKACEMFIMDLTMRSWSHTEENKRRTLQKNDIAAAVSRTDVFDFLVDIIPKDEFKEDTRVTIPLMGPPAADSGPYYYVPQQHAVGPAGFYPDQQQNHQPLPYMQWHQPQHDQNQQQQENGN
ncbi:nuclear transcription factor Y subunit C-2-like isoform X2 [Apium graveolens]|uniref:nuclear transcription factor Y subunit C-2-like isoform X2 n=1 Tax=Apium graveolens TaxID=4045 RepID=UPI003D7931EB